MSFNEKRFESYARTVETLHQWFLNGSLDLNASFQRGYCWNEKKASNLIKSLLQKYPIPNIFLLKTDMDNYQVVDGKQRLTSIFNFLTGRLELHESCVESLDQIDDKNDGLDSICSLFKESEDGYSFENLTARNKRRIKDYEITCITLIGDDWTSSTVHDIFHRIDSGEVHSFGELANSRDSTFIKMIRECVHANLEVLLDLCRRKKKQFTRKDDLTLVLTMFFSHDLDYPEGIACPKKLGLILDRFEKKQARQSSVNLDPEGRCNEISLFLKKSMKLLHRHREITKTKKTIDKYDVMLLHYFWKYDQEKFQNFFDTFILSLKNHQFNLYSSNKKLMNRIQIVKSYKF